MTEPDAWGGEERRADADERDRIDELAEWLRRAVRQLRVGLLVFGAATVAAIGVVYLLYGKVQHSREQNMTDACEVSNVRHDRALAELDWRLAEGVIGRQARREPPADALADAMAKATPAVRKQIGNGRSFSVAIIEILAPHVEDCAATAHARVSP